MEGCVRRNLHIPLFAKSGFTAVSMIQKEKQNGK